MPIQLLGTRVVTGPDWLSSDGDESGKGQVGTIVGFPPEDEDDQAHNATGAAQDVDILVHVPRKATVEWDVGDAGTYCCGAEDKFELRILDTAPSGIRHTGEQCSECKEQDVFGLLWMCRDCAGVNLCSACYHDNAHDVDHPFCVMWRPGSSRTVVPKRNSSASVTTEGIFPGACVGRGMHWKYGQQDGGAGSTGDVCRIINTEENGLVTGRSTVLVEWADGDKLEYRLGHCGKVDLKCVQAETGGDVYLEHLPVLGFVADDVVENESTTTAEKDVEEKEVAQCSGDDSESEASDPPATDIQSDSLPEAQPHLQPEPEMATQSSCPGDIEADVQTDSQLETQADVQTQISVNMEPNIEPGTQPSIRESAHPDIQPDSLTVTNEEPTETPPPKEEDASEEESGEITAGCLVQLQEMELDLLQMLQMEVDCWDDSMTAMTNKIGCVEFVDESNGGVCVAYPQQPQIYIYHPATIAKVKLFKPGDRVSIIGDARLRMDMMAKYGGWNADIEKHCGVVGEVVTRAENHTAMVKFGDDTLCLHPSCLAKGSVAERRAGDDTAAQDTVSPASTESPLPGSTGGTPASASAGAVPDDVNKEARVEDEAVTPVVAPSESHDPDEDNTPVMDFHEMMATLDSSAALSLQNIENAGIGSLLAVTMMMKLMIEGNIQVLEKALVSQKKYVNSRITDMKWSLMHLAGEIGDPAIVQLLHGHGCDLNIQDSQGGTPLHKACSGRKMGAITALLKLGARLDIANKLGAFPIHIAAGSGNVQILRLLVTHGDSHGIPAKKQVSLKSSVTGETPLYLATDCAARGCVEQLVAYGAPLGDETASGQSYLHVAVFRNSVGETSLPESRVIAADEDPNEFTPLINEIQQTLTFETELGNRTAAIACFLAQQGCDIYYMNHSGEAVIEFCADDVMRELLLKYYRPPGSDPPESDSLAPVQSEESRDEVEDGSMSSEKEVLTAKEMAREKDEVEVEVMETESPPSEDDDISKGAAEDVQSKEYSSDVDTAESAMEPSDEVVVQRPAQAHLYVSSKGANRSKKQASSVSPRRSAPRLACNFQRPAEQRKPK